MEDFTTYTEVDDNSRFVVTATKIAVTALNRGDDNERVVKDYGVDFVDGDFTHTNQVKITAVSTTSAQMAVWCLANVSDEITQLTDGLYVKYLGTNIYRLYEEVSNTPYTDSSITLTLGTQYYLSYVRDETIGSFGQLQCFIYDDVDRTSLVDTLTLTLHSKADFRYVYGVNGEQGLAGPTITGDIENLELGAVVAAAVQKFAGIFGVGRMGGIS